MATHRHTAQNVKTTVLVTKEIIDASVKADSKKCMIADALKEAMPWAKSLSVDLQTIRFSDTERGVRYIYLTPPLAQQQLLRFDQGLPLQPWVLKLPVRPSQLVKIMSGRKDKNTRNRPLSPGPKTVVAPEGWVPQVRGGIPPPIGTLAHAGHPGGSRKEAAPPGAVPASEKHGQIEPETRGAQEGEKHDEVVPPGVLKYAEKASGPAAKRKGPRFRVFGVKAAGGYLLGNNEETLEEALLGASSE